MLSMLPWYVRWIMLVVALAAAAAFGAVKMHGHDLAKYEVLQQAYDDFKSQVKANGDVAAAAAAKQKAADQKRKEDTDAQNKAAHAAAGVAIDGMRRATDSAASGFLPAPAPGASQPGTTCFGTTALESAYGKLTQGLRGLADEGTDYQLNLDSDKTWAQSK